MLQALFRYRIRSSLGVVALILYFNGLVIWLTRVQVDQKVLSWKSLSYSWFVNVSIPGIVLCVALATIYSSRMYRHKTAMNNVVLLADYRAKRNDKLGV